MIERVSEMATGRDWEQALKMSVYEFLSIYSYSIDKQNHQEAIMRENYNRMKR